MNNLILKNPDILNDENINTVRKQFDLKHNEYLADIVIIYKEDSIDRIINLYFLLNYIYKHYGNLFNIIIVECDIEKKLKLDGDIEKKLKLETNNLQITYHFLYNPSLFNRGWIINCALKNYTKSEIFIPMDTDAIVNYSFLNDVIECRNKYDVVFPCKILYWTNKNEKEIILKNKYYDLTPNTESIVCPTSHTGFFFIIKQKLLLDLGGFEEYCGYGCEDRAMDVTILSLVDKNKIKYSNEVGVHLWHPPSNKNNVDYNLKHLAENYKCGIYYESCISKSLHAQCTHSSQEKIKELSENRKKYIGNINKFL